MGVQVHSDRSQRSWMDGSLKTSKITRQQAQGLVRPPSLVFEKSALCIPTSNSSHPWILISCVLPSGSTPCGVDLCHERPAGRSPVGQSQYVIRFVPQDVSSREVQPTAVALRLVLMLVVWKQCGLTPARSVHASSSRAFDVEMKALVAADCQRFGRGAYG